MDYIKTLYKCSLNLKIKYWIKVGVGRSSAWLAPRIGSRVQCTLGTDIKVGGATYTVRIGPKKAWKFCPSAGLSNQHEAEHCLSVGHHWLVMEKTVCPTPQSCPAWMRFWRRTAYGEWAAADSKVRKVIVWELDTHAHANFMNKSLSAH